MNEKLAEHLQSHLHRIPPTATLEVAGQRFVFYITDMELTRNHRTEGYDVRIRLGRGAWVTLPEPEEEGE